VGRVDGLDDLEHREFCSGAVGQSPYPPVLVPSGIFVPERQEVMGKWKQRQTDELHNFYCPPGIMLVTPTTIWAGHIARMVEMRKA
jgi:hypothetical protein